MKEPTKNFENLIIGRLSSAELKRMALQQHRQIELQNQLLASKDHRLFLLKSEDLRHSGIHDEEERLRGLRERVELQESKLNRLRAFRGQVDLQKTYNASLSNDLDSIRTLFCEKEKELSLAVAKVEALTRQLEELKKDKRCTSKFKTRNENFIIRSLPIQTSRELEKLRREVLYHNQQSFQHNSRIQMQREALQQRQAELYSVNQRIFELQKRLQKKRVSNVQNCAQFYTSKLINPVELQQNINYRASKSNHDINKALSNVKQQMVAKPLQRTQISGKLNDISLSRALSGGNVAAVEPFIYTPVASVANPLANNTTRAVSADNIESQHNIQTNQDVTHNKFNTTQSNSFKSCAESDETKLTKKLSTSIPTPAIPVSKQKKDIQNFNHLYAEVGEKKRNAIKDVSTNELQSNSTSNSANSVSASKIPKSRNSDDVIASKFMNKMNTETHEQFREQEKQGLKKIENNNNITKSTFAKVEKFHETQPLTNLTISARKPISSVAPTSVASSIPKKIFYNSKVNCVAPNSLATNSTTISSFNLSRPSLPPKPNKITANDPSTSKTSESIKVTSTSITSNSLSTNSAGDLSLKSTSARTESDVPASSGFQALNINDSLPIKAKPLTIRKQPLLEQPRLKLNTSNKLNARKLEITSYLSNSSNDCDETLNTSKEDSLKTPEQNSNGSLRDQDSITGITSSDGCKDETDKDQSHTSPRRITKSNSKPKLTRRVSFDPLALLLDASLEGEVELVKKTVSQVANPSAANDEGITALHNAICAGHFDIVKFLIEFGCDVNAQDSDGWTPLHCAASCNNLTMVKYLVENGACLFAVTLSDHETPAEKCEEDEEGFDGCSEYLYNIQEKLGVLHNGEVFAVFSYEAQNNDELSFNLNDRLNILRKDDDTENEWWWASNLEGKEGYVPRNLLGLYPRVTSHGSSLDAVNSG